MRTNKVRHFDKWQYTFALDSLPMRTLNASVRMKLHRGLEINFIPPHGSAIEEALYEEGGVS